ncbi:MAG: DNA-directed RNA polymerase subunit beta, partial [Phycisphaerae bacterium]
MVEFQEHLVAAIRISRVQDGCGGKLHQAGDTVVAQGKKITASLFKALKDQKIHEVEVAPNDLEGAHFAADVIDMETGEILAEANHKLSETHFSKFLDAGIEGIEIFFPERDEVGVVISETIRKDEKKSQNESLLEIYRKLRPGDPPTIDTATQLFQGMFFD